MTANNLAGRFTPSLFCLLFLLTTAAPARATVARAVAFDAKVDEADTIVLGQCKSTRSQLDPTGRWIVTYSTFAVKKSFKGNRVGEITIVTPGGKVGDLYQSTVGIPEFRPGDEKVLFVKQRELGPTILYANQGSYDVTADARGNAAIVPTDSDVVLIDDQTGRARSGAEPYRSIRDFEAEVKAALNRTEAQPPVQSSLTPKGSAGAAPPWHSGIRSFALQNRFVIAALMIGLFLSLIPLLKKR